VFQYTPAERIKRVRFAVAQPSEKHIVDINKLIARVKNILLTPKTEWPVIAAEPDSVAGLYTNYIVILAAIPAVFGFIKNSIIGFGAFGITMRTPIGAGITGMIVGYAMSLALAFVMALIIDALAPSFGAQKSQVQALKTVAYAWTASWVASVALILPGIGWLIAVAGGIYGIYLLYLGLTQTMKCPIDRAGGYTAVSIIIAIVLSWIVMLVVAGIVGTGAMMSGASGVHLGSNHSDVQIDANSALGKLAAIGQRAEEANQKMDAAKKSGDANAQAQAAGAVLGAVLGGGDQVEALAPDMLKPFLPETLGGLPRTSFEASRNAPIGIQVSNAKATYRGPQGGAQLELEVTDTGGAKGIMALAGFAGMEEDKQSDSGYEKTYHQDGRMINEKWNKDGNGEFTIVLGDRFVVAVHGSGVASIDALKSAVGSINLAGLEALKNTGVKKG
jgi:Yip1-like protein